MRSMTTDCLGSEVKELGRACPSPSSSITSRMLALLDSHLSAHVVRGENIPRPSFVVLQSIRKSGYRSSKFI
jgi:hypothetical protein